MRAQALLSGAVAALVFAASPLGATAQITPDAPGGRPAAIVDLATDEGVRLVKGQWRYSDVKIVDVEHRAPGPDLKPSGPPNRTYDIAPTPEPPISTTRGGPCCPPPSCRRARARAA